MLLISVLLVEIFKMMFFRLFFLLIAVLSLMVSACSDEKKEQPKGRPPALVLTAISSRQNVPVQLKAIGAMEASERVEIRTQISGELTKVAFREGEDVQKGALLFQLDSRPYQAALRKAEANLTRNRVLLANARRDYERYAQLAREGIITQEQAEGYRTRADSFAADVEADNAAVDSAREQLGYCTIKAPISGRLGALAVDRGNVVKDNDTVLVTINTLTPINAVFTIPEKDFPEVKKHMAARTIAIEAEVPGESGIRERGVISFIDNSVDPATGTIRLKASFENPRKQLWPGQFVNLSMILSVRENAVVVPTQAVQTGQQGQFVFVVKPDTTAELRPVVTGPVHQRLTLIEKGLQPGEQVVVDGQMRVIPGSKVQIVKEPGTGGQGPAQR